MMNQLTDFIIFMKNSTGAAWEHMLNYIIFMPVVDTYGTGMSV